MSVSRQPVRPQFVIALSAVVLILAPAVIIWLIWRYGVNTIVWDQIEIGRFLVRNHDRAFPDLADLFAQHNESRKFFPRILFFYLARLTHWNVKYEMAVSFLMACGVAVNLFVLTRRSVAATALCAILVFSPVQWWNWLFGIQIVVFAPILMLTTALVVLRSITPARVIAAALLCVIATFSYANGMLLWIVLMIPLWQHRRLIPLWFVAATGTIGLYFYGYHKPPGHPALASPLSDPIHFATYVLAFLGHPLAWAREVRVAAAIGAIAVLVFMGLLWRRRPALAAAAIGSYAILSACATATGRLGLTLPQALEPRYMTFSIYLFVAIVMLMPMRAMFASLLVALHVLAVWAAWPEMILNYRERLLARTAVQLALVSPDRQALREFVWPYTPQAIATIDGLSRIGYVQPPLLRSDVINQLVADATPRYGAVQRVTPLGTNAAEISGWAALPGPSVADAVVLTRSVPDGEHIVAISIRTALERPDVASIDRALLHSGWIARVPSSLLQNGTTLNAWAWDSSQARAFRLSGGVKAQ